MAYVWHMDAVGTGHDPDKTHVGHQAGASSHHVFGQQHRLASRLDGNPQELQPAAPHRERSGLQVVWSKARGEESMPRARRASPRGATVIPGGKNRRIPSLRAELPLG